MTKAELKEWIKSYVAVHGPVKGMVMATEKEFATYQGQMVKDGRETASVVLHDMVIDGEIEEWEYTVPDMRYRTKSLYVIPGTELVQ